VRLFAFQSKVRLNRVFTTATPAAALGVSPCSRRSAGGHGSAQLVESIEPIRSAGRVTESCGRVTSVEALASLSISRKTTTIGNGGLSRTLTARPSSALLLRQEPETC
jgi:hypothetical protein